MPAWRRDGLGIALSTRTINPGIDEAGQAVEPIEEQGVAALQPASLAYADATPWQAGGQLLWRGVIITPTLCGYLMGARRQERLAHVFGEGCVGWLRRDGYHVYRHFQHRRRGGAHRRRQAEGRNPSLTAEARAFGQATHDLLSDLRTAIDPAREGPPVDLTPPFRDRLDAFAQVGEQ